MSSTRKMANAMEASARDMQGAMFGGAMHPAELAAKKQDSDRVRQLVDLRARSPMRSTRPQADAGDLALFIAGNEPSLL